MYDFHLSEYIDDSKLRRALATCFGCDSTDVRLIDDVDGPDQFDGCIVLAQRYSRGGDFPLAVSVVGAPAAFDAREYDLAVQICQLTNCCALICDSTVNPYNWIVLDGIGNRMEILVDGDALDDRDVFVIPASRRPTWFCR